MEEWPDGYGSGQPNQRSQVQNHMVAEKMPQPFNLQRSI